MSRVKGVGITAEAPDFEANYNLALSHEQQFAGKVASRVMEKPQVSVWMFLFPLIMIPFMQRVQQFKESLNLFTRGYLFTKQLALDAALKVNIEGRSQKEAVADAELLVNRSKTAPGRNAGNECTDYRQKVRECQLEEIDMLVDHYHALLSSTGNNYHTLVSCAYKSRENYVRFLTLLEEAEKQVNQASVKAYGNEVENIPVIIAKMERTLASLRAAETEKIFGSE